MDFKDHDRNLTIIGKIFIVLSLISIPFSVFSFFFLEVLSTSDFWMEVKELDFFLFHIEAPMNLLHLFSVLCFLGSVLFLVAGIGLVREKPWAKNFAMIPAVILLFKFPIGSALGIYMIYAIHYREDKKVANIK